MVAILAIEWRTLNAQMSLKIWLLVSFSFSLTYLQALVVYNVLRIFTTAIIVFV
jgi:hypothetical protein